MSREIKFRICYTDQQGTKQMIYKDEHLMLSLNGTVYGNYGTKEYPTWEPVFDAYEQPFIQQYTGMKDKNGKEIYEGDLLRMITEGMVYEVVYNSEYTAFTCRVHNYHLRADASDALCDLWCVDCKEVIGNIFENPELIIKS